MKTVKLKPYQKVLTLMISGNPVTREEIQSLLGDEIYMYRISTYMWHIKTIANGIIRINKSGRKVISYQLVNVDEIKEYMRRTGTLNTNYTPGDMVKKPSLSKLAQLGAESITENVNAEKTQAV